MFSILESFRQEFCRVRETLVVVYHKLLYLCVTTCALHTYILAYIFNRCREKWLTDALGSSVRVAERLLMTW